MRSIVANPGIEPGASPTDRPQFDALINQFHDYQSASDPVTRAGKKSKFAALQVFVQDVLDDPTASFEVSGDRTRVFVNTRNGEMQLSKLGTGIEELLILAAAATFSPGALVCVEEPELHLHPTLQRQLVRYLQAQTETRFLMSTHSPQVINAPDVRVLQATMVSGDTKIDRAIRPSDRSRVAFSIGARASDVVQSNFTIWVEGPSDRLYLNAWIQSIDKDLVEGAHYSIVSYGGRLLSHLSFDDDQIQDLVRLQSVSRHFAIVIDSDRAAANSDLNDTKKRIVAEVQKAGSIAWVTAGREIENYVSLERLSQALAVRYPAKTFTVEPGKWGDRLGRDFDGQRTGPSKVTVAEEVASSWTEDDWQLDCRDRVVNLVTEIRRANQ
jgi:hypothetical protein